MLNNDEVGAPVRSYAIVSAITNKVDVVKAIDSQKAINEAVHSYPQHNTTRNNPELTNYFSYELTFFHLFRFHNQQYHQEIDQ